jgi:hypothetical protein
MSAAGIAAGAEEEKMMPEILVVCCVCHKVIGTKDGHGVEGVSHTYCNDHARELLAGLNLEAADAVDA